MRIIADLHLHSAASDGELTPETLVHEAARRGLKVIALTDHDSLSGVQAAITSGNKIGVQVIPGCELTAYLDQTELHILGIGIDASSSSLVKLLKDMQERRPQRLLEIAAKLRSIQVPVSDDEVVAMAANSNAPGRAHVAAVLVKKGIVPDMRSAFIKYLSPSAPAYVPKPLESPERIIGAIHDAGGLALLAHPGQYQRDDLLPAILKCGIDGFEAYHPSHNKTETQRYAELARHTAKLMSGGSDYHGPRLKPGIEIGTFGLNQKQWEEFSKRTALV